MNGTVWPNCADVPLGNYSLTHPLESKPITENLAQTKFGEKFNIGC